MGFYQRTLRRLGRSATFARIGRTFAPPIDLVLHRATNGRVSLAGSTLPTLILGHRGAKSNKEYRTPLAYFAHGEEVVIVASNWGGPKHPAWSYNLTANPAVTVHVGGRQLSVIARQLSVEEIAEIWPQIVKAWPGYDDYRERSGREIRLFALKKATDVAKP